MVGIARKTVAGQFVRSVFDAEYQTVAVEVVARHGQTGLPDAALIVLITGIDALMALVSVIEIPVQASGHAEPVFHMVSHLGPGVPFVRLTERHVLYQVVRVHEEASSIYQN